MNVNVRAATVGDALEVATLLHDFNTEFDAPVPDLPTLTRRFSEMLARTDVLVLLAEGGATAVGFAYLTFRPSPYSDGPLAQMEELYVRPELRSEGIGTRLLERAVALTQERQGKEMHINVDEVDADTRRFYERHGFVNIEPGEDYRMLCYLRAL
ncbi:L-amino acid N-acyltransferase YncA [Deinococcus reticulitermitis]|uniref:L-amino acid N-acyltransferase YncA n=1 Tax=Deinococcus reticulitermitis TaxID=856736 RepID=A0A1H6YW93_9DEIO|nr:GNAT family N-acetyltransferase [Deinococcus reticulitermitis]SEJ45441.1 L-amino acid N-acyltransferase YncA [Deinococcus reticulitermitis]